MKKKDPNYVVKLEKAIREKYGEKPFKIPSMIGARKKRNNILKISKNFMLVGVKTKRRTKLR